MVGRIVNFGSQAPEGDWTTKPAKYYGTKVLSQDNSHIVGQFGSLWELGHQTKQKNKRYLVVIVIYN